MMFTMTSLLFIMVLLMLGVSIGVLSETRRWTVACCLLLVAYFVSFTILLNCYIRPVEARMESLGRYNELQHFRAWAHEEGFNRGHGSGYSAWQECGDILLINYDSGWADGRSYGYHDGFTRGFEDGHNVGTRDMYDYINENVCTLDFGCGYEDYMKFLNGENHGQDD